MSIATRIREPVHPALVTHVEERAKSLQNRIADRITLLAGSMVFIYVHIVWFTLWITLGRRGVSLRPLDDDRLA
jgi:uncharacterized membrane protein